MRMTTVNENKAGIRKAASGMAPISKVFTTVSALEYKNRNGKCFNSIIKINGKYITADKGI